MKGILSILLLVVMFPDRALSEEPHSFVEMGVGTLSCATFAKLYNSMPREIESKYFDWAQGFISGFNIARASEGQPIFEMSSISVDDQQRMIRQYCDKHPLADYQEAVMDLIKNMKPLPPPKISN